MKQKKKIKGVFIIDFAFLAAFFCVFFKYMQVKGLKTEKNDELKTPETTVKIIKTIPETEQIKPDAWELQQEESSKQATAKLQQEGLEVPEEYIPYFEEAGQAYNISPELLEAVAFSESRFKAGVTNGNCKGIMQVNVRLHKARLDKYGGDWRNPRTNIMAGADLIAELAANGNEDLGSIMSMYHGEGSPEKYSNYTAKVAELTAALERQATK